jgi:hypothetical protein
MPRDRVTEYIDPANHEYDDPTLDSLAFMRAVQRDQRLPVSIRLEAADKLAPYEHPKPKPISQREQRERDSAAKFAAQVRAAISKVQ